ncbi:MAG: response regulator, partial [Peptococcaceae bacterium]|nr:response regulator [Peptococcaceae bacterium]
MARILVVDDEEPIRELLKFNLEKEGYDVSLAADGIQALALTASLPPDLVVLDVMIPGINGMDVCRDLRQNPL